jgi:hypothetical protein
LQQAGGKVAERMRGLSATSGMALERRLEPGGVSSIRDDVYRGEVRVAISGIPGKEEG